MSAKLIVHKFETGFNFKSLQITFKESDSDLSDTNFSEWLDGRSFQKKKETEKSSRLVVKIVSGSEISNFNFDTCAKLISNIEMNSCQNYYTNENDHTNTSSNRHIEILNSNVCNPNEGFKPYDSYYQCDNEQSQVNEHYITSNNNLMWAKIYNNSCFNQNVVCQNTLSPLEYSLEKVKENNARIMENIHMLNRTLNYTKKKEILDIVCPKSMRSFPCDTCGKCFVYETGLKRHYTMRHSMLESQPRWQVVWTCIECFQVWPQHDLALKHSGQCCRSDSADCVREIKTSSLLQCEFCEKVFTSIPRLVRHAKMHTTQNNYECNMCEITFSSFKTAEEHWLMCPWLKTCYSFSLPKLLLCNACDRKFRNYEQLYNHRYKVSHFMAKINSNSLDTYLYQCELCGKCFPSTSPLQVHRRQCHPFHDTSSCNIVKSCNEFHSNYFTPTEIEDGYINNQN